MTPASGSASSTGTQSAARTIRTTPGAVGDQRVGRRRAASRRRAALDDVDHVAAVHLVEVGEARARAKSSSDAAAGLGAGAAASAAAEVEVEESSERD